MRLQTRNCPIQPWIQLRVTVSLDCFSAHASLYLWQAEVQGGASFSSLQKITEYHLPTSKLWMMATPKNETIGHLRKIFLWNSSTWVVGGILNQKANKSQSFFPSNDHKLVTWALKGAPRDCCQNCQSSYLVSMSPNPMFLSFLSSHLRSVAIDRTVSILLQKLSLYARAMDHSCVCLALQLNTLNSFKAACDGQNPRLVADFIFPLYWDISPLSALETDAMEKRVLNVSRAHSPVAETRSMWREQFCLVPKD